MLQRENFVRGLTASLQIIYWCLLYLVMVPVFIDLMGKSFTFGGRAGPTCYLAAAASPYWPLQFSALAGSWKHIFSVYGHSTWILHLKCISLFSGLGRPSLWNLIFICQHVTVINMKFLSSFLHATVNFAGNSHSLDCIPFLAGATAASAGGNLGRRRPKSGSGAQGDPPCSSAPGQWLRPQRLMVGPQGGF